MSNPEGATCGSGAAGYRPLTYSNSTENGSSDNLEHAFAAADASLDELFVNTIHILQPFEVVAVIWKHGNVNEVAFSRLPSRCVKWERLVTAPQRRCGLTANHIPECSMAKTFWSVFSNPYDVLEGSYAFLCIVLSEVCPSVCNWKVQTHVFKFFSTCSGIKCFDTI